MASEERTKFLGILFVRSEAFQVFGGTAAAVIQQDGGERSAALRAPKHRVQCGRPTVDEHGFRPARRLAADRRGREHKKEWCQNQRAQLCHLAFPSFWMRWMQPTLSEWAKYI